MGRGPHTVPLRALLRHWRGLAPGPRPPQEQVQPHPPPPRVAVPSVGEGGPLGSGGVEGRSCGSLAGGGAGGGWRGRPPAPLPRDPNPYTRYLVLLSKMSRVLMPLL